MQHFIGNVVIGTPPGWNERERREEGRDLGTFYARLLGQRIIRFDWVKVGSDRRTYPQLAFGDGGGEPPRWPDPDYPQQMHIDFAVPDVEASEALVLEMGATKLADGVYADPAGHPFCLRKGDGPRIERVVIDCPTPRELADFYEGVLGMRRVLDTTDLVVIEGEPSGSAEWPDMPVRTWRGVQLAFQRVEHYVPPRWGDDRYPLQLHLDVWFRDGDKAHAIAESLGGTVIPGGVNGDVYADPAGHPLCLIREVPGTSPVELLAKAVRGQSDAQIMAVADSFGGAPQLLDAVVGGVAAALEPSGNCVIGISVGADFTVSVTPDGATHKTGRATNADAVIHMSTPDFLRFVVRELLPDEAIATERLKIDGDASAVDRFFAMLANA